MSIISKAFAILKGTLKPILKPFANPLKRLLQELVPKPVQQSAGDPVYSISISNEYPNPGDPKPLLAGQPTFYPLLLSLWTEYVGNKQVVHAYLYVCYGAASPRELLFAGAPLSSLGSYAMQELRPGDTGTLANHNVYVNRDIEGTELPGGALDLRQYTCNVTFNADGSIVVNSVDSDASESIFSDPPFGDSVVGGLFTVTGSAYNDSQFSIATITDGQHVTVAETPTDETVDCVLNVYKVVIGSAAVWLKSADEIAGVESDDPSEIAVVFDATNNTIKAPLAASWQDFAVGDLLQAYRSADNDGIDYTITALIDEYAVVDPAPVDGSDTCSIILVRRRPGPFALCPPGRTMTGFNVNVLAETGLYRTNKKGKLRSLTVGFETQIQLIDDLGNPLGPIQSLGETNVTGKTQTAQRRTIPFMGLPEGRYQMFPARSSPATDDSGRADAIKIESTVAFLTPGDVDPHYDATGTRLMIDLTSTSAIPQGSENKFKVRYQAEHPIWDAEAGEWTAPQATNDIAPFWAALRRAWGNEIDTDAYVEANAAWQAAGWEFHAWLTGSATLADATNDVLLAGDARKWIKALTGNVDSMWRDRLRDDPVLALHDNNVGSTSLDEIPYGLLPEDVATGIVAQYSDARTGEDREVQIGDCTTRPETVKYAGVISRQQAWELGNRELGRRHKRLRNGSADVLWLQRAVGFGSPLLVQSYQHGMGQMAMLVSQSGTTLIADAEFEWHPTLPHRVWTVDPNGVPSAPINCSRGADDRTLVLESAPAGLSTGEDGGECTALLLGYAGNEPAKALCAGIDASDADYVAGLSVVFDDDSIFDDPGDAPDDEYPVSGDLPDLTIADLSAGVVDLTVTATWTPPAASVSNAVEYRLTGATSWTSIPPVSSGTAGFSVTAGGTYQVRVRAFGPAGSVGPLTAPVDAVVTGPAFSVTSLVTDIYADASTSAILSAPMPLSIIGGIGPITGVWTLISGSAGVTPLDATDPNSRFQATVVAPGTSKVAVYRYTATDATMATADSPDISITLTHLATSGPIP